MFVNDDCVDELTTLGGVHQVTLSTACFISTKYYSNACNDTRVLNITRMTRGDEAGLGTESHQTV